MFEGCATSHLRSDKSSSHVRKGSFINKLASAATCKARRLQYGAAGLLDATLEDDSAKGLLVNQTYVLIARQCIRSTAKAAVKPIEANASRHTIFNFTLRRGGSSPLIRKLLPFVNCTRSPEKKDFKSAFLELRLTRLPPRAGLLKTTATANTTATGLRARQQPSSCRLAVQASDPCRAAAAYGEGAP